MKSFHPKTRNFVVMKNRIPWVDCAKGIGIFLVVYGHVARGISGSGLVPETFVFQWVDYLIYSFHMPLFFFLSGMFFLYGYRRKGITLITNKFLILIYPYLLWSIVQTGVKIILGGHTNHSAHLTDILKLLWIPVEQFWFLYSLLIIILFEILWFSILKKLDFSEGISVMVIGVVSLTLFFLRPFLPGVFQLQTLAEYMVFFHGGIIFSFFTKKTSRNNSIPILLWCLPLFFMSSIAYRLWLQNISLLPLFSGFFGIGIVIGLTYALHSYLREVLSYLGKYSMEIYCIHILTASGLRIILINIFHISSPGFHLTTGLIAGLLLPILFSTLCRKHPWGTLFFRPPVRKMA